MEGGRSSFPLAKTTSRTMPETHKTTLVAAIDCPGGGQVRIDVTTESQGLIYLTDHRRNEHVIEFTGAS
jgi:hypothetical protein